MHIRVMANRCYRHKGFVYSRESFDSDTETIELHVRPRRGSKPRCSHCGHAGSVHDVLAPRKFQFLPLWTYAVFLVYAMRRVDCRHCNAVFVEQVPWAEGKSRVTHAFAHHLASWARSLSWTEVSERFHVGWKVVARSVQWLVAWGLANRSLSGITAIGVDEIAYGKGHRYLTLVYQIDHHCRRLLWIGKDRTAEAFHGFFDMLGQKRCNRLRFVCSDMWKAYLQVIAERAKKCLNILDKFHIVKHLNEEIDQTRRDEVHALNASGKPAYLTKSRWILLRRWGNLTRPGMRKIKDLMACNLKTIKAYLFKEEFQRLWTYRAPWAASRFMTTWCRDVLRHRTLKRLHKFAGMIERHHDLILNYFRASKAYSSGIIEGFNGKAKLCFRKSYGFRTDKFREVALYHALGDLPEPQDTHRFG